MPEGTIKWFNQRKGFGFVTGADGRDLFVHYTHVNPETREQLVEGQPVIYQVASGDKGPMAVQVDVVSVQPPAPESEQAAPAESPEPSEPDRPADQ